MTPKRKKRVSSFRIHPRPVKTETCPGVLGSNGGGRRGEKKQSVAVMWSIKKLVAFEYAIANGLKDGIYKGQGVNGS